MSVFAIGDLHLSFGVGEEKSMDRFGGPWVDHAEHVRECWLAAVGAGDTVIIPGDLSWAMRLAAAMPDFKWLSELPGRKVLVRGNHDLWWASLSKMNDICPDVHFVQNNCYEGDGFIVLGSRGWLCPGDEDFKELTDRKIYDREILRLKLSIADAMECKKRRDEEGKSTVLIGAMHFPPTNEKKQMSDFTELFSAAGVRDVVYGHLHGENAYQNGPAGIIDGVNYHLCSLDKLNCIPKLIL